MLINDDNEFQSWEIAFGTEMIFSIKEDDSFAAYLSINKDNKPGEHHATLHMGPFCNIPSNFLTFVYNQYNNSYDGYLTIIQVSEKDVLDMIAVAIQKEVYRNIEKVGE